MKPKHLEFLDPLQKFGSGLRVLCAAFLFSVSSPRAIADFTNMKELLHCSQEASQPLNKTTFSQDILPAARAIEQSNTTGF